MAACPGDPGTHQQVPDAIPARLHHHLAPIRWYGASEVHIPMGTLCRAAGMKIAAPSKEVFSASMPLSARNSAGRESHERGLWHTQSKGLQDWHLQKRDQVNGGILFHGDGGRWNAAQLSSAQAAFDTLVVKLHALLEEPNAELEVALKAESGEIIAEEALQEAPRPWSPSVVGDNLEKQLSVIKAERMKWTKALVWTLALWRRFGTVAFAQTAGWIFPEADVDAQKAALDDIINAAVGLWMTGRHAVLDGVEPAWHAFEAERKAWQLGGNKEQQDHLRELETVRVPTNCPYPQHQCNNAQGGSRRAEEIREMRRALVTPAGEQAVRKAYRTLLFGRQQEVFDLWRSLESVAKTALEGDFLSLVHRLAQVKGFDLTAGFLAREVALDLKTMTPLADDAGPVTWSIDYVTWLRKRLRINPVSKAKLASQKVEETTCTTTRVVKTEKKTNKVVKRSGSKT